MAQNEGHEVLYSQPHYFDLQPIEIVWDIVKGDVDQQYLTETSFKDILECLKHTFCTLQTHTVQGCINQCKSEAERTLPTIGAFRRC